MKDFDVLKDRLALLETENDDVHRLINIITQELIPIIERLRYEVDTLRQAMPAKEKPMKRSEIIRKKMVRAGYMDGRLTIGNPSVIGVTRTATEIEAQFAEKARGATMLSTEIAKATGYAAEAFECIEKDEILRAYELSPGIFEFCSEGPMGPEYQFSNEILPYTDGTLEWNKEFKRFEGVFWGQLDRKGFILKGWLTVDASDSTAYLPIEFDVHVVVDPDGNELPPSDYGIEAILTEGIDEVFYEI